jgi:hypothetical protein
MASFGVGGVDLGGGVVDLVGGFGSIFRFLLIFLANFPICLAILLLLFSD